MHLTSQSPPTKPSKGTLSPLPDSMKLPIVVKTELALDATFTVRLMLLLANNKRTTSESRLILLCQ